MKISKHILKVIDIVYTMTGIVLPFVVAYESNVMTCILSLAGSFVLPIVEMNLFHYHDFIEPLTRYGCSSKEELIQRRDALITVPLALEMLAFSILYWEIILVYCC